MVFSASHRQFSRIVHQPHHMNWMAEGSQKLAKAVELTLGPGGRTVMIDPYEKANFNALSKYPDPVITKDGVTVAKAINYLASEEDQVRGRLNNIGAKLFFDAAQTTNDESGDGTTSCMIIARSLLEEGLKYR